VPKATKEEWAKRVERWKGSGLTVAQYAALNCLARTLSGRVNCLHFGEG